jgi:hypothetical protein
VWIDCGGLWTLQGSHSRPKHAAALPSRGTPIFGATERTNLDLRINWKHSQIVILSLFYINPAVFCT